MDCLSFLLSERLFVGGGRRWLTMVQEVGQEGEAKEESYQAFLKELCIFEQQVSGNLLSSF